MASIQTRALGHVLSEMTKGAFDVSGSPQDIREAAYALLASLGPGDEFVTVCVECAF